ncbi:LysR family transcriptional regulator [Gemmobacter fulvus]|uniref:LysR family transcriptional regulator n=1 Tax=Gemmobacter fulvus TaxID=2840474 RepID=A0A975P8P5_9RHOB|nr:LysR family transcriptional regulator [Gemmobacter fulvus]MBT9244592.1 LysR family transcriptional regulator [Gemmobacter fulvus]QWK91452.1 LysR family transcriptional regulator [Gemmobacter fulvus]
MAVAPPRAKDLPLTALRAFEAAARLGGFAAAATELGVTPGAVTAHVKALEAALGAALFDRIAKGVRLTPLGQRVLPEFTQAFDALGLAVHALRLEAAPRVVHIATLPAIAQLFLSPRLPALRAQMPEVVISITAMEAPPNLKRAPYDLSLFYGDHGQILAEDEIFPVCAPALAARLHQPADLAQVPCLTDSAWAGDWALWAALALPGQSFAPRGPVFSLYALALEEAAGGAGVLMGHGALVAGHLARGALVAPFAQRLRLPHALRLWSARPLRSGHPVERVARWLHGVGG